MNRSSGIRALQQHASQVVARAAAGEEIEITDRGRPVARLVPVGRDRVDQLIQSGRLRPARRKPELPKLLHLPAGQPSASEVLAKMRDNER